MISPDVFVLLKLLLYGVGIILLALVSYLLFQTIQVVRDVRRILDRIEVLTDIRGMFDLFRRFVRPKRKRND